MSKPELARLQSTAFEGYHYDPSTRALTVTFTNGATWRYEDVPIERAEAFAGNASPGSYFASKIKGLYSGRKV